MGNPPNKSPGEDENLASPDRLSSGLKSLYPVPIVPRELDESILSEARRALSVLATDSVESRLARPGNPWGKSSRSRSGRLLTFPRWLAAAAVLVAAAIILAVIGIPIRRGVVLAGDLDRNGTLDMLDAFALARRIQTGVAPGREFDFNGDGVVDQRDIDWIARRAVQLPAK